MHFFTLLVLSLVNSIESETAIPEQVHLSLTNRADRVAVTFLTKEIVPRKYSGVHFALLDEEAAVTNESIKRAIAQEVHWSPSKTVTRWTTRPEVGGDRASGGKTRFTHRATLDGLKPGRLYEYYVECDTKRAGPFRFRAPKLSNTSSLCLFGDMGLRNAQILPTLLRTDCDVVVHIGDIAYNLETSDGLVGDAFMRLIEPLSSKIPYMVVAGNHEFADKFRHFRHRFTMPSPESSLKEDADAQNHYWAVTIGPVRLIGVSSEFLPFRRIRHARRQYLWLKEELETNKAPWKVVVMHRPFYCSDLYAPSCSRYDQIRVGTPDVPGLEELFVRYHVDFVIAGHKHFYERLWPTAWSVPENGNSSRHTEEKYQNPRAPVYVLAGTGGNDEDYVHRNYTPKPYSVVRRTDFGFLRTEFRAPTEGEPRRANVKFVSADNQILDNFDVEHDLNERGTTFPNRQIPATPSSLSVTSPKPGNQLEDDERLVEVLV